MFQFILNTCDEDLKLWVGNIFFKVQTDDAVVFKMFSAKIAQCTRASVLLASTSLHSITLKDQNNDVEKLVNEMECKIKLLSWGGEESNSGFSDAFHMFSKAPNHELRSLVQQYSRLHGEGTVHRHYWLPSALVTKHKYLVSEGEQKESKDESQFVVMLQKIQKEN